MPQKWTLPAQAAEKALAAAEEAGVPRPRLLAAAEAGKLGTALSFETLCAIYEQAARLTGDDAFGLHVGERTSPRMYGRLGYIAANSGNLAEALASVAEYQRVWTEAAGVDLRHRGDAVSLLYWHRGGIAPERRRQESEQMLSALLAFARWAVEGALHPKEVRFEHRAPADVREHARIFGGPIVFGARAAEIVFSAESLALPIPRADGILGAMMREQAAPALAERLRREPFLDQLRDRLRATIARSQEVSLADLARAAGIGPRTLQRRLRQRGLTFRAMADEARIELAKSLLVEPDLALGQIAFRLGHSQTSAFHRKFRRLTGTSPGEFRRSARAHEERF